MARTSHLARMSWPEHRVFCEVAGRAVGTGSNSEPPILSLFVLAGSGSGSGSVSRVLALCSVLLLLSNERQLNWH